MRSSNQPNHSAFQGLDLVFGQPLEKRSLDFAFQQARRARFASSEWTQACVRLAIFYEHDLLAGVSALEQFRKLRLGLLNVDFGHLKSLVNSVDQVNLSASPKSGHAPGSLHVLECKHLDVDTWTKQIGCSSAIRR